MGDGGWGVRGEGCVCRLGASHRVGGRQGLEGGRNEGSQGYTGEQHAENESVPPRVGLALNNALDSTRHSQDPAEEHKLRDGADANEQSTQQRVQGRERAQHSHRASNARQAHRGGSG